MSIVFDYIRQEQDRQATNIELIASENFVSEDIKKAVGSCLTNKYCEGYPDLDRSGNRGRYYGGCQVIDKLEQYCCETWQKVFKTDYHVNVQPHCGSSANMEAYMAVLQPCDTILAMSLDNGGHLSHGSLVNFSGKTYDVKFYNVDDNGFIDYDDLQRKIVAYQPRLVLAGASAYSRVIDFERINRIIDNVCADYVRRGIEYDKPYFMVDMAHIAGLIAVGEHPSPFGLADIVTTTTHKTLRGPRGGLIFCKPELAKKIDSAVFPGAQGGPLEHVIAGKAICAEEALQLEFKSYIQQVKKNAKAMANAFQELGYTIVSGGTDNHMFLLDLRTKYPNVTGRQVQDLLDEASITLNKNCVPNDQRSPKETSGVRIGTPAMTTKGWKEQDFIECAKTIDNLINKAFSN